MSDALNPVRLGAREIPPPETISPQARAYLSTCAANPAFGWPPASDLPAWRARIADRDRLFEPISQALIEGSDASLTDETIGGVPCTIGVPAGMSAADGPLYLYIHGGGFVFGGGLYPRAQAAAHAARLGLVTVSVDYRMPPDHPFPAAPEDCVAVYAALRARYPGRSIVIGGGSAGGNLAAVATLMIRDRGMAMPAGVVLLTPEVDLTESGDSFRTNETLDVLLKAGLPECNALYAGETPLDDPWLSPLFADLAGFPPAFVQTGTRDLFLSNSVLFHRKLRAAGVRAALHVWEAMPHGGFGGATPEDAELFAEIAAFVHDVTGA